MIPLSVPYLNGNEWVYIKECLDTNWVSSVGSYVNKFEEMMAEFTGTHHAIAAMNGTAALHLSLRIAGVSTDDYVIVPNITFIASVNAIRYCGAHPILIDVEAGSWQMDLELLADFLESSTERDEQGLLLKANGKKIKAIMPVHVLGNMCDMHRLMQLSEKYGLEVIEDATEALGSYYKDQHAGSFGRFGCFSYNGNKIITTGGGGMIVTNREVDAKRAKHLSTQAKSDPFEYAHDDVGHNYRLVNVLAAMGVAQMEQLTGFIARKHEIAQFYHSELQGVGDISFQTTAPEVKPNHWLFTIGTSQQRELLKTLNSKGIQSRPFWVPMNRLPMFTEELFVHGDSPVSDGVYARCLSLPCSSGITDDELKEVAQTIKEFYA